MPSTLYTINPSWNRCGPGIHGLWDPPYTLTTADGFFVPKSGVPLAATGPTPAPVTASSSRGLPVARPPKLETKSTETQQPPKMSQQPPSTTTKNNPITAEVQLTPKITPALAEPEEGHSLVTANFLQRTTVSISVRAEPVSANAASASITAFVLGSQTLKLGEQVTYVGETYSLASNGDFIVGTQTLNPGAQITGYGTTYSRAPNGGFLIINGTSTQVLVSPLSSAFVIGSQTLSLGGQITYDGETYSLASNGAFIVGSQTLNPEEQITDSGTTYSRASNGVSVIVDGNTTEVLGSLASSIGGAGGTVNGPNIVGAGSPSRGDKSIWVIGSALLIILLLILEL